MSNLQYHSEAPTLRQKMIGAMLNETKSKYFKVTFVKKNGEIREMTCQTGVKKFLADNPRICFNGTSNTVAHLPQYIKVYETPNPSKGIEGGYKNLNLDTITYFKCGSVEFNF